MKETNKKEMKQLDEKELEQVTGGAGNNQTNPAAPDAQGDEGQKITGSVPSRYQMSKKTKVKKITGTVPFSADAPTEDD